MLWLYSGYIGIMENMMEAAIVYWGYRDNGRDNGTCHSAESLSVHRV